MDIKELFNENEKPLDKLVSDGGFCGIFQTIGCVGDSLTAGEMESCDKEGNKGYHDYFEYSWGKYIERDAGCKTQIFAQGGMTAQAYCESFASDKDYWNPEKRCQAYIIALGVNDINVFGENLGSVADVDVDNWRNNQKTFAGFYAQIIQRLKKNQPKAKFFLVTLPHYCEFESKSVAEDNHQKILHDFAKLFDNTYVLDLREYAPVYDKEFVDKFFTGGHLNAAGYRLTAKMLESYIDYIIRHNFEDFKTVAFIGKEPDFYSEAEK